MGKCRTRLARLIVIGAAVAASLVSASGGLAFCNPRSGESSTCVHDIEINPKRLTTVEISKSSMAYMERLLELHKFLELSDIRIAVNQMNERFRASSIVGFHYDVPVGSAAKNSDCQLYDLSRTPSQTFNTSLLYGLDCTLATKVLLRYTSMIVDMQEGARMKKQKMGSMTDDQLIELYSSTRYFNTAVSYAFHGLEGPAREYDFDEVAWIWGRKAWPWGLTESGIHLPAGGVIEYRVQPGDTWESISSTFIGDPEQTSGIAKINPEFAQSEPPVSGEELYVPLDVQEWVTVDVNERAPDDIAREVYGDERFAEMVTRRCRVGAAVAVPKCAVPIFHDAPAVYEAFFAE